MPIIRSTRVDDKVNYYCLNISVFVKEQKEPSRCSSVEVLLMLVTQHVSGIIMPIIRSTRRGDKIN
jgi:hypothetical protein